MTSDVADLFEQRLLELRGLMDAVSANLRQHSSDMPDEMTNTWDATWGTLHDLVNSVSCHQCEDRIGTRFTIDGPVCEDCAEKVS